MDAYANVMSGRHVKWYSLAWVGRLLTRMALGNLIVITFVYQTFYYVAIPVLIVSMFIVMVRMQNQLDTIEAAVNGQTQITD